MKRVVAIGTLVMGLTYCAPVFAIGGDGGGDGGSGGGIIAGGETGPGCCGEVLERALQFYPSADRDRAVELLQWLRGQESDLVSFLSREERICRHVACNGLEPGLVRQLAADALTQQRRAEAREINLLIAGGTVFSAVVALASLILAYFSDRRSRKNERDLLAIRMRP